MFGGTFNPIHSCHLRVADRVRDLVGLDRVIFVPAADPPHKSVDLEAPDHRFAMTRLAVAEWPDFVADDLELRRPGPSYSADTMGEFRRRHPDADLFFLLGIEMFRELATWRDPERLLAYCRLIVIGRSGSPFAGLAGLPWLRDAAPSDLARLDAQEGEAAIDLAPACPIVLVKPEPCELSSTQVRRDLVAGRVGRNVLPGPVWSYILKNKLYGVRDPGVPPNPPSEEPARP